MLFLSVVVVVKIIIKKCKNICTLVNITLNCIENESDQKKYIYLIF